MNYLVTANVNAEPNGAGFRGYQPGHKIATVGWFDVEAGSFEAAAGVMWEIGNREATDTEGQAWPADVRSLSVGDLLFVASNEVIDGRSDYRVLAVAGFGWTEVPLPADHLFVPLAATYRELV
jgi:hypothetical protein